MIDVLELKNNEYTRSFNELQDMIDRVFKNDIPSTDTIIKTTEQFMITADKYIQMLNKEIKK